MLPRKYKLKKDNDFKKVFKQGKNYQQEFIRLKILENNLKISRFGLIVGLKISKKAVERNKIKRRLEEVIRLKPLKPGFDVIILVSPEIVGKNYQIIEQSLTFLLKKAKILE